MMFNIFCLRLRGLDSKEVVFEALKDSCICCFVFKEQNSKETKAHRCIAVASDKCNNRFLFCTVQWDS